MPELERHAEDVVEQVDRAVGRLEVHADGARLVAILDWTRIITTGLTFFGLWMIVRALRGRRK